MNSENHTSPRQAGDLSVVGGSASVVRRIAHPDGPVEKPVKLWQWNGIRLMTHEALSYSMAGRLRVSEETTGMGVPQSFGHDEKEAEAKAVATLERTVHRLAAEIARYPLLNNEPSERAAP